MNLSSETEISLVQITLYQDYTDFPHISPVLSLNYP
jgi:hypothetical protein